MILKKLLNLQALKSIKEFKDKHKEVFDIAIYGSVVRGKIDFNDIDFAIIFSSKMKEDEKLSLSQELKSILKKSLNFELDIKGVDIFDLLDNSFLARKAIIAEGFLIIKNEFLHSLFGFDNYSIFSYSLKNLNNSRKVMFQYALRGRRGEEGLIALNNATLLGKGVLKVPLEHTQEFEEFFENNKIDYKIKHGLYY